MRYIHDTKGRARNLTRKNGVGVTTTTESCVSTSHHVQSDGMHTQRYYPPRGSFIEIISWSHNRETKCCSNHG